MANKTPTAEDTLLELVRLYDIYAEAAEHRTALKVAALGIDLAFRWGYVEIETFFRLVKDEQTIKQRNYEAFLTDNNIYTTN